MGDSFDESFRRTMFHAAMAQRNAEMTYYLDTAPTQYCGNGKVYSTYLMHRGTQACQFRSNVQRLGVYANVHVGIEAARKIQSAAMPCPVCLRQSVEQSFADTSRSYTNIYFCNGDANGDQFKNNFMGGGGVCGVACWRCEKYDHFDRLDQEHANNYMSCFRNFERRDLTGGYTL